MLRKGIILAGGKGSRLAPLTETISKQLLPVYNKPLIYYSLSTLMLAGLREILIITSPRDVEKFRMLLGDGSNYGISISYVVQQEPNGIAEALILGENFLDGAPCCLILGDNVFHGRGLTEVLLEANDNKGEAIIFSYQVSNPEAYGVVEFNKEGEILSLQEKPKKPRSNHVITGIYFFDGNASEYAKELKASDRGELEITDLVKMYWQKNKLRVRVLNRGIAWFDTGTHEDLLEASNYVRSIEKRQGALVCSIEEVALHKGFVEKNTFLQNLSKKSKLPYFKTLIDSLETD